MEFIAFSDSHFYNNASKSYTTELGFSSWFMEQVNIVESIFEYARENNIKMILFLGDLFEEKNRISVPVYNKVYDLFSKSGFRVILNTGNHDIFSIDTNSSLRPFSSICDVVTRGMDLTSSDSPFLLRAIPFGQVSPELLSCPKGDSFKILLLHELIDGLEHGITKQKFQSDLKPHFLSEWDLVLNGHIHKPQEINNIINIGSIMAHDFGEAGEQKRFIHFKNGETKSIPINHPKFITLNGLSEKVIHKINGNNRDFFRIDIDPSDLSDKIFNKFNVFPNVVKKKEKKLRLRTTLSIDEEIQEYLNIIDTELDKEKLLQYGRKFIEEE